jgi:glycine cleavage system H protein
MNIHYTVDHEWIVIQNDIATVGITDHAQRLLGDLVFVQLPQVGQEIEKGSEAAVIESVKAASDVFAPLSGTVLEVNTSVSENPAVINADPMGVGWLFKLSVSEPLEISTLLSQSAYEASLQ